MACWLCQHGSTTTRSMQKLSVCSIRIASLSMCTCCLMLQPALAVPRQWTYLRCPPGSAPASATAPSVGPSATAATLPTRAHPGLPHAAWATGDSQQLTLVALPSWNVYPTVSVLLMFDDQWCNLKCIVVSLASCHSEWQACCSHTCHIS
jgi:hypothetical protein